MSPRTIKLLAAVTALAASTLPAAAASGRVVDPEGAPLAGARACILVGGDQDGVCVETNEAGSYQLMPTRLPSVRISAKGFLSVKVAAVDQAAPIVLRRAASLRVRLLDAATGAPIPKGEVFITYSTGARRGPLPSNAAGVRVHTLEPGQVVVTARAEGHREGKAAPIVLTGGHEAEVVVKLDPGEAGASKAPPDTPAAR